MSQPGESKPPWSCPLGLSVCYFANTSLFPAVAAQHLIFQRHMCFSQGGMVRIKELIMIISLTFPWVSPFLLISLAQHLMFEILSRVFFSSVGLFCFQSSWVKTHPFGHFVQLEIEEEKTYYFPPPFSFCCTELMFIEAVLKGHTQAPLLFASQYSAY